MAVTTQVPVEEFLKIAGYLAFGVGYIGVPDPGTRPAFIHTSSGAQKVDSGVPHPGHSAFEIPLSDIFD